MRPSSAPARVLDRIGSAFRARRVPIYLVGGSVRDELLDRVHEDLDLTTPAEPPHVREILRDAAPRAIFDVGERFGTIGAMFDDEDGPMKVEVTTYRSDSYVSGSRKPGVTFGTSLVDDLARRDFSINAMARAVDEDEIIDPFGGQIDLRARRVRAVGEAASRFAEDPLRMLRAVRFAAQLGFSIERETADAIVESARTLATISRERVVEEMHRILLSDEVARGLELLVEFGLMEWIIPELLALIETTDGNRTKHVFAHTVRVVENAPPVLVTRWAALLHDIGKPSTRIVVDGEVHFPGHEVVGESLARAILQRLRLEGDLNERIARLVGLHMRVNQYSDEWTDGAIRRLMREAGDDFGTLLDLSAADVTSARTHRVARARGRVAALRRRAGDLVAREAISDLRSPLDGTELMALFGRSPGPWIRPIKAHLLDLVLDGSLATSDKEAARDIALAFVATSQEREA